MWMHWWERWIWLLPWIFFIDLYILGRINYVELVLMFRRSWWTLAIYLKKGLQVHLCCSDIVTFWFTEELCHIELCPCEWRFRVHGMFRIIIIIYVLLLMGLLCLICFLVMFFFFYMLFLLGGLFKRTFHVEKTAERDKLAVTMRKKTGGRFKDDWDWLKMKGGNEQKRPTWIISVDVSMAVSWLINCGYQLFTNWDDLPSTMQRRKACV